MTSLSQIPHRIHSYIQYTQLLLHITLLLVRFDTNQVLGHDGQNGTFRFVVEILPHNYNKDTKNKAL